MSGAKGSCLGCGRVISDGEKHAGDCALVRESFLSGRVYSYTKGSHPFLEPGDPMAQASEGPDPSPAELRALYAMRRRAAWQDLHDNGPSAHQGRPTVDDGPVASGNTDPQGDGLTPEATGVASRPARGLVGYGAVVLLVFAAWCVGVWTGWVLGSDDGQSAEYRGAP